MVYYNDSIEIFTRKYIAMTTKNRKIIKKRYFKRNTMRNFISISNIKSKYDREKKRITEFEFIQFKMMII